MRRLFASCLFASCLLVALAAIPSAAAPSVARAQADGPATRYLRQRHEDVNRILRRPASTDAARATRSREVTRVLSDLLDYDELSRRALGTHWEAQSEADRAEFTTLLRQLVERNYEQNLERVVDFEVTYTAESSSADGVVVRTEARSRVERRQPPVEIAYSLHQDGAVWRVFDVVTDGVSLVRNYRNQFNRIITQHDFAELLRRMRERLGRGGE